MTEPTELIAEVRRRQFQKPNVDGPVGGMYLTDLASALADALEAAESKIARVGAWWSLRRTDWLTCAHELDGLKDLDVILTEGKTP